MRLPTSYLLWLATLLPTSSATLYALMGGGPNRNVSFGVLDRTTGRFQITGPKEGIILGSPSVLGCDLAFQSVGPGAPAWLIHASTPNAAGNAVYKMSAKRGKTLQNVSVALPFPDLVLSGAYENTTGDFLGWIAGGTVDGDHIVRVDMTRGNVSVVARQVAPNSPLTCFMQYVQPIQPQAPLGRVLVAAVSGGTTNILNVDLATNSTGNNTINTTAISGGIGPYCAWPSLNSTTPGFPGLLSVTFDFLGDPMGLQSIDTASGQVVQLATFNGTEQWTAPWYGPMACDTQGKVAYALAANFTTQTLLVMHPDQPGVPHKALPVVLPRGYAEAGFSLRQIRWA